MRLTFQYETRVKAGAAGYADASNNAEGASIPAPVGGWDAYNPIAAMPETNAVSLVNFFPQPGYVEVRRGFLDHCDTGTDAPVETVMGFMGQDTTKDTLIAASNGSLFDVTTGTPSTLGTGYTNDRWQFTDFAGVSATSFLWMCNGDDPPQYYDGTSITVTSITCSDGGNPDHFIQVVPYNSRLWCVLKNSTKAYYLGLDAVDGTATVFDVGPQFVNGGYLTSIGTFSTDTINGPTEYICFVSSQGDVVVYLIPDPTSASQVIYRGRSEISQPVGGPRSMCKSGADLLILTLDGVLPLSRVLSYDKAKQIEFTLSNNIKAAITSAVRSYKDNFGWMMHSYPRNTMLILNVPISEDVLQQQYVMNTVTNTWAQFEGQNACCWEVFLDKPYFGGNDGIVRLADTSAGDENQTLNADMQMAFNYYGARGQLKRWTSIRPNVKIDASYPVTPQIALNVDYSTSAALQPIDLSTAGFISLWNAANWNTGVWAGDIDVVEWNGIGGLGYCSSIRMNVSIPWDSSLVTEKNLQINGFDILMSRGGYI